MDRQPDPDFELRTPLDRWLTLAWVASSIVPITIPLALMGRAPADSIEWALMRICMIAGPISCAVALLACRQLSRRWKLSRLGVVLVFWLASLLAAVVTPLWIMAVLAASTPGLPHGPGGLSGLASNIWLVEGPASLLGVLIGSPLALLAGLVAALVLFRRRRPMIGVVS